MTAHTGVKHNHWTPQTCCLVEQNVSREDQAGLVDAPLCALCPSGRAAGGDDLGDVDGASIPKYDLRIRNHLHLTRQTSRF